MGPRYEFGRIISSGMIGNVYLAEAKDNKSVVCIKQMLGKKMAEKNIFQSVRRELKILNEVQKIDGCIKIFDVITDPSSLSLVMPWYPLGDLYFYAKVSPERVMKQKDAQHICRQMVQILSGIHEMGIIHRDLKPENLLVADSKFTIQLSDFGFAIKEKELFKEGLYTRVGTLEFLPIEMLLPGCCPWNWGHDKIWYDRRVDIWSLGVMIFELLYGHTPFYTPSQVTILPDGKKVDRKDDMTKDKIRSLRYKFPKLRTGAVYTEAEDLFRRIFVKPDERITLAEMKQHPWLLKKLD